MTEYLMLEKALKALTLRGAVVAPRMRFYDGQHPFPPGSDAWSKSWRERLVKIIDNLCVRIIEIRADAVQPASIEARTDDKLAAALAVWAAELFASEAHTLVEAVRHAEATGSQVTVAVDWNADGVEDFYLFDDGSCYVQLDRAGAYLWALHLWKEDVTDAPTQATLYTPTETIHYETFSTSMLPCAGDMRESGRLVNRFGELMLATVDKAGSLIDRMAPGQLRLNKSLQTMHVVGEAYALPFRVYLGVETYNPDTGEVSGAMPELNPATGGRDVSFPTVVDSEGVARQVLQFASPDPAVYLAEQDAERVAISNAGYVPGSSVTVRGARPVSAEAQEIEDRPNIQRAASDWLVYRPFYDRLLRLSVRMYLYRATGRIQDAPRFHITPVDVSKGTAASRSAAMSAAVAAGVSLEDALVRFYGMDREAAALVAGNANANAAATADRAAALAGQGYLGA